MTNRSADDSKKPEGVDLPQTIGSSLGKSSDEILAELFCTLNAKPPESVKISTDNKSKKSEKYKHHKKNKKRKRKHKSKSKKDKRKQMSSTRSKISRSSSSSDICDTGDASFHNENAIPSPSSVDKSIPLCDTADVSKCPKPIENDTSQYLCENAEAIQQEMQTDGLGSDCSQSKKDLGSNDINENVHPASNISHIEPSNTLSSMDVSNNMEAALGITTDVEERNKICLSSSADAIGPSVLANIEQSIVLSRPKGEEETKKPPDSSTAVADKMTKGPNIESESLKQSSSPHKKLGKRKDASPEQRRSHQNSKRRRSQDARHRSKSLEVSHQALKNDRKSRDKDDHHGSKKKRSRSHDRRRRSRSCSKTARSTDGKRNTSSCRDSKRPSSGTKRKSRSRERDSQHDVKHNKKHEGSNHSKSKRKKTRSQSRSKGPSKRSSSRDRSTDKKSSKKNQGRSSSRGEKISQDTTKPDDPKRSVSTDRKTSENSKSVDKNIDSINCKKDISDSNVESLANTLDEDHCSTNEEEQSKCVDSNPSMETGSLMSDKDLSSPRRDKKSSSPVVDGSEDCHNTDCKENPQKLGLNEDRVIVEIKENNECNDSVENQHEILKQDSHSHESITTKNIAKDNHRSDKGRSKSTDSHSRRSGRKSRSRSRDKDSKRTSKRKQSKSKDRHTHRNDRKSRSRSRSKHRHNRRSKSLSKHRKSRSHSKHRVDKKSRSRSKHRSDKRSRTRSRSKHRSDKRSRTRSRSKHRSDKRSRTRSRSKHRNDKRSRSHSKHRSDKKSRSRSHSKQKSDRKSRSHSKHRTDKRSRSHSKHRSNRRSRSKSHHKRRKSISKEREDNKKQTTRSKSKDTERTNKKSRSKSRDKDKSSRSERKSRSRSHDRSHRSSRKKRSRSREVHIDKRKLFEIARKNAMSMLKQSVVPFGAENIVAIKAGGKSVEELTDFCKQLSKKEGGVSSDENEHDDERNSDSDVEKPFHHPFQLKERPSNIVLNIRNSVPVPTKTFQEKTVEQSKQLRLQFPVSSGQNHRKTESEWVPVEPSSSSANDQSSNAQACSIASQLNQSLNQTLTQAISTVAAAAPSTGIPAVEAADVPSSRLCYSLSYS